MVAFDDLLLTMTGRPGAGRRTVAEAMRAAGARFKADGEDADVTLYVLVDVPNDEDREALSGMVRQGRPCLAVLNKSDLSGFRGAGPMAAAAARCRALSREIGVPSAPLAALAARAGCRGVDDVVLVGVRMLALDPVRLTAALRRLLLTELDLYGLAHAVAAVRAGAAADGVAAALRRASGIDGVMAAVDRAAAPVRYRRCASETALRRSRGGAHVVAEDTTAAADVLRSAGLRSAEPPTDGAAKPDCLRRAIVWHRYAHGPVGELHRDCARDLSRAWLRQWAAL